METFAKLPEIDLGVVEVPSYDFSPIPEGDYNVQVADVKVTSPKAGKFPSIGFNLVILDGEFKNRRITYFTYPYNNETCLRIFKGALKAFGFSESEIVEFGKDLKKYLPSTIGCKARAKIKEETYNGKTQEKVKFVNAPSPAYKNKEGILESFKELRGFAASVVNSEDIPF